MAWVGDRARVAKRGQGLPGPPAIHRFADMGRAAAGPYHFRTDNIHTITAVCHCVSYQPGLRAIPGICHLPDHAAGGNVKFIQKTSRHDGLIRIVHTNHLPRARHARRSSCIRGCLYCRRWSSGSGGTATQQQDRDGNGKRMFQCIHSNKYLTSCSISNFLRKSRYSSLKVCLA